MHGDWVGGNFRSHRAGVLGSITICFLLSGFSQTSSLGPHVSCRLGNRQRQPLILAKRATFSGAHIDGDVASANTSSLLTRPDGPRRKARSTKNKHLVALLRGIVNRMALGRELVFLVFCSSASPWRCVFLLYLKRAQRRAACNSRESWKSLNISRLHFHNPSSSLLMFVAVVNKNYLRTFTYLHSHINTKFWMYVNQVGPTLTKITNSYMK